MQGVFPQSIALPQSSHGCDFSLRALIFYFCFTPYLLGHRWILQSPSPLLVPDSHVLASFGERETQLMWATIGRTLLQTGKNSTILLLTVPDQESLAQWHISAVGKQSGALKNQILVCIRQAEQPSALLCPSPPTGIFSSDR